LVLKAGGLGAKAEKTTRESSNWTDRTPAERPPSTTMGSGQGLKSVKVEPPPVTQTVQPRQTWGLAHRPRVIAVGVLIGVALWFVHKRHTLVPEPWLEGHFDPLGYDKSYLLTGKEAEDLFL